MNPDPQIRTRTRTHTRTRSSRRFSACYRHPSEPVTGFCALCLRDRLAGLDDANADAGESSSTSTLRQQLRRSKSVVDGRSEVVSGLTDQRRRSCDVRTSSSSRLSDLFVRDDVVKGVENELRIESRNLGFDIGEEIKIGGSEVRVSDLEKEDVIEEEFKTMKEYIDLECRISSSSRKSNARNLFGAASVFSSKLKKWGLKEKSKRRDGLTERREVGKDARSEVADYGLGRRSCDTEPRFSIDGNRMSVDDPRFSIDEPPRASWDGYLIARTIPRLTPMLSVVDDVILGSLNRADNLQMQVINEDVGHSGELGQSNSDSSSSDRRSGSDRSSSIKSSAKGLGSEGDELGCNLNAKVSPINDVIFQGTKLVITEKELKDWHMSSVKHENLENGESVSLATGNGSNGFKRTTTSKWRKMCNFLGHKPKYDEKKGGEFIGKEGPLKLGSEIDGLQKGFSNGKLIRSSSVVGSRTGPEMVGSYGSARACSKKGREEFVLERNKSGRHSMSDLDSGLLRFHLTPFRNYSRSKSGKNRVKNLPALARNGILLN